MPIPTPSNETQSEYISKCISAIGDEYDTQEQALAVCYSKWRESKMEGVNLLEDGTVNFEEPCWKGYTQIGMKVKNGELVPNCVPKD